MLERARMAFWTWTRHVGLGLVVVGYVRLRMKPRRSACVVLAFWRASLCYCCAAVTRSCAAANAQRAARCQDSIQLRHWTPIRHVGIHHRDAGERWWTETPWTLPSCHVGLHRPIISLDQEPRGNTWQTCIILVHP